MNLEDFSLFKSGGPDLEGKEEEKRIEELEVYYQNKLLELQKKFELELERVKKEYYEKGFIDGQKKKENELKEIFEDKLKSLLKEKEEEISTIKENFSEALNNLENQSREKIQKFLEIISSSLIEILDYLYISDSNLEFLERKIKEIISSFSEEPLIAVEVGENLYRYLKDKGLKVSLNKELNGCDFIIRFNDFRVESNFSEKLENIRSEFEKEIKELTKT